MNNVKEYNSLPSIQLVENRGWTTTSLHGEKTYVPADWTTPRMKDLVSFHRGNGIPKGAVAEDGTYPCVLYGQLFTTYGRTIFKAVSKTSSPGNVEGMVGDVLVPSSTTTTGEDLACASALLISGVFIGSDINILRPKTDLDSTWLARKITSMKREVGSVATGLTIIHVYNKNLAELQLQAPPPAEQTLIAQVLTAQESQVHDLRKLAQAERQRLTWLSDELLSGRLRVEEDPTAESVVVSRNEKGEPVEVLPGVKVVENRGWKTVEVNGKRALIPDQWEAGPLSLIAQVIAGQSPSGSLVTSGKPTEQSYDFHQGNADFGVSHTLNSGKVIPKSLAPRFCKKGTLLMSVRAPVGAINFASNDLCFGRGLCAIKVEQGSKEYLYFQLNKNKEHLQSNAQGSTFEAVKISDVRELEILIAPHSEQTLIAQVLTAQETQVSEIERLADLEQQRFEWLSDELLSGRIRVKTTKED